MFNKEGLFLGIYLWLTPKAISDLFDTSKQDVSYHLKMYLIHSN